MSRPDVGSQTRLLPDEAVTGEREDLRAAIYARTSSASQRFGYSIDEQVRRCWDRCEALNWEVRYVFADEAESGRDMERPEFQRLLEIAECGAIEVVVFWKLDRFCRSLVDLVKTEEELSEWDVALESVTEYINTTTAVGRFNFRNLASAAELETDLTSQRVQMGMYGLATEHKWPNDDPPLGYDLLESGRLQINEEEAGLVRRIYRTYLREESMPQVAHLLNEVGIPSPSGNEWCAQSVKKIVSNELYAGRYSVADYEEYVEEYQIVSDEIFEEVTDTRFRFKSKGMDKDRKKTKAEQILTQYKQSRGGSEQ